MNILSETRWEKQSRQLTPAEAALAIFNYIDASLLRRARATELNMSFGGAVIGNRQSLAKPEHTGRLIRDVNEAVTAVGGIRAMVNGMQINLVGWRGEDPEDPSQQLWLGQDPYNPDEFAHVSIDVASL